MPQVLRRSNSWTHQCDTAKRTTLPVHLSSAVWCAYIAEYKYSAACGVRRVSRSLLTWSACAWTCLLFALDLGLGFRTLDDFIWPLGWVVPVEDLTAKREVDIAVWQAALPIAGQRSTGSGHDPGQAAGQTSNHCPSPSPTQAILTQRTVGGPAWPAQVLSYGNQPPRSCRHEKECSYIGIFRWKEKIGNIRIGLCNDWLDGCMMKWDWQGGCGETLGQDYLPKGNYHSEYPIQMDLMRVS